MTLTLTVLNRLAGCVILFLCVVGTSLGVAVEEANGRMLAKGGSTDYRIVVAKECPPSVAYAARELQSYLRKMTGAKFPVVTEVEPVKAHEILVGRSSRVDATGLKVNWPDLGKEGYVVRTVEEKLILAGGDPRGTLYAVYDLLEDHLGCRWFTPELERVPKMKQLPLPQLDERKVPAFEYREIYAWDTFDGNWMARNRLNGAGGRGRLAERQKIYPPVPELDEKHGGSIRFGFGFFVHTFEKLAPGYKYFPEHPEYFALVKGKRKASQLCCTNEEAIRLCAEGLLQGMREQPKATVFSLSQNDNKQYCECERCQALANAEGTQMAPMLHLVNRVAEVVEKEFPDKIVLTLAYQYTRHAPKTMRPRRNVVIWLCDIECCFAHPLASGCTPANMAFVEDLKLWAKVCDRLWMWDYAVNFSHYLLPLPNKRLLDDNVRLFAANHVTGLFEEGAYDTSDSEFAALKAYLLAKFLWNPDYDENVALSEFLAAYYGAAAPSVRKYLDFTHDYTEKKPVDVGIYVAPTHPQLTPEMLVQATGLWNEAESLAHEDSSVLDRVRRSRMSLDYVIMEQARVLKKVLEKDRIDQQRALIKLARSRFGAFGRTLRESKLTRIKEWKNVDKKAYLKMLAIDLGLEAAPVRPAKKPNTR